MFKRYGDIVDVNYKNEYAFIVFISLFVNLIQKEYNSI